MLAFYDYPAEHWVHIRTTTPIESMFVKVRLRTNKTNKKWKQKYGYHTRFLSKNATYRAKQLLGASLTLRNYNAQVGETYAMIKAFNKLTGIDMPKTQCVV